MEHKLDVSMGLRRVLRDEYILQSAFVWLAHFSNECEQFRAEVAAGADVTHWMDGHGYRQRWFDFRTGHSGVVPLTRLPAGHCLLALGVTWWTPNELCPPMYHHFTLENGVAGTRETYWILARRDPHPEFDSMNGEDMYWLAFHFGMRAEGYRFCQRLTPVRP